MQIDVAVSKAGGPFGGNSNVARFTSAKEVKESVQEKLIQNATAAGTKIASKADGQANLAEVPFVKFALDSGLTADFLAKLTELIDVSADAKTVAFDAVDTKNVMKLGRLFGQIEEQGEGKPTCPESSCSTCGGC